MFKKIRDCRDLRAQVHKSPGREDSAGLRCRRTSVGASVQPALCMHRHCSMIFLALEGSFPRPENILSSLIVAAAALSWKRGKLRPLAHLNLIIGTTVLIVFFFFSKLNPWRCVLTWMSTGHLVPWGATHFLGYLVSLLPEKDAGVLIDEKVRTSKMVIQVKTLAGKPEDQSSIPRTHRVEWEN